MIGGVLDYHSESNWYSLFGTNFTIVHDSQHKGKPSNINLPCEWPCLPWFITMVITASNENIIFLTEIFIRKVPMLKQLSFFIVQSIICIFTNLLLNESITIFSDQSIAVYIPYKSNVCLSFYVQKKINRAKNNGSNTVREPKTTHYKYPCSIKYTDIGILCWACISRYHRRAATNHSQQMGWFLISSSFFF